MTDLLAGVLVLAVITQITVALLAGHPSGGGALLRWTGRRLRQPIPAADAATLTRRVVRREQSGAAGATIAAVVLSPVYLRHRQLAHPRHPYDALWLLIPCTAAVAGRVIGQWTAANDEASLRQTVAHVQAQSEVQVQVQEPATGPAVLTDHVSRLEPIAARLLLLVVVPATAAAMYVHQAGHFRHLATAVARAMVIPIAVGLLAAVELTALRLAELPRPGPWDGALLSADIRQVYALAMGAGVGLTLVLAAGLGLPEAVEATGLYLVLGTVLLVSVLARPLRERPVTGPAGSPSAARAR